MSSKWKLIATCMPVLHWLGLATLSRTVASSLRILLICASSPVSHRARRWSRKYNSRMFGVASYAGKWDYKIMTL